MVYRFTFVAMIVFKFPGYPVVYGCVSYPREFIISMIFNITDEINYNYFYINILDALVHLSNYK